MREAAAAEKSAVETVLTIDEQNRFFFDHPLDHVPAMLLLDATLWAAQKLHPPRAVTVTALRMRFDRFCEKDQPALVRVERTAATGGGRLLDARVVQAGADVCRAELRLEPALGPAPLETWSSPGASTSPRSRPAEPRLVHKRSTARVLVGPLSRGRAGTLTTPMLAPTRLWAPTHDVHPVTLLVEAARQASTMVSHTVWGTPSDWQFIVGALELSLPARAPGPQSPVFRCHPRRGRRRDKSVVCELLVGDAPTGKVSFAGRTVPPGAYRRLREAALRARTGTEAADGVREVAR